MPKTLANGVVRSYRVPEPQECILLSSSVTERPEIIESPLDVKQTFRAEFKKPLIGNGLSDIKLYPNQFYNVTSYFGCYKRVFLGGKLIEGA